MSDELNVIDDGILRKFIHIVQNAELFQFLFRGIGNLGLSEGRAVDGKAPTDPACHLHRLVGLYHIETDDGALSDQPDIGHFIALRYNFLQEGLGLAN